MKTKLIFSTETNYKEQWVDLPFIPRTKELLNVKDFLEHEEHVCIQESANCWSGIHGTIQSIEYCHDDNNFYVEIYIWCED